MVEPTRPKPSRAPPRPTAKPKPKPKPSRAPPKPSRAKPRPSKRPAEEEAVVATSSGPPPPPPFPRRVRQRRSASVETVRYPEVILPTAEEASREDDRQIREGVAAIERRTARRRAPLNKKPPALMAASEEPKEPKEPKRKAAPKKVRWQPRMTVRRIPVS
jgi:hypothetical protein